MGNRSVWGSLCAALGILALILDSKTALGGAVEGIRLCLWTVIPSLFPFLLLSNRIMAGISGVPFSALVPLGKLFLLPRGLESILIPGFLGGYPIGAQCIAQVYRDGMISRRSAENMLAFCSNAGPAFLFGMVGRLFPRLWMPWALWGIQILSAALVSRWFPCGDVASGSAGRTRGQTSMAASLGAMASICGWVTVFRVVIAFLERWILWLLSGPGSVLVCGFLELSNGCLALDAVENLTLRFVLCSGIISFGGLCVLMQTASVTEGLSLRPYLLGKTMQAAFSMALSLGFLRQPWLTSGLIIGYFLLFHRKSGNNSRNSRLLVV